MSRGGKIVFTTIIENVKSFFGREDELTATPRAIPEAASEVFERPKIVDKPLPQQAPKLPFSPDELRAAMNTPPPKPAPKPEPAVEHRDVTHEIHHEIAAFEAALASTPAPVKAAPTVARQAIPAPLPSPPVNMPAPYVHEEPGQLFFGEFDQFLKREDFESDGVLGKDLLWRMKEFHRNRQEGKEYYLYAKDTQLAIERKIAELKGLEKEWFGRREQADLIEKELHVLEGEIESRTSELKHLVKQSNAKSRLEHVVPAGYEFTLMDGRKLTSLLDLKTALRGMPDTVFNHHVTSIRNDFASWVRGAMNDPLLADKIGPIRDRVQLELYLSHLSDEKLQQIPGK